MYLAAESLEKMDNWIEKFKNGKLYFDKGEGVFQSLKKI